jgi:hypothetical protein
VYSTLVALALEQVADAPLGLARVARSGLVLEGGYDGRPEKMSAAVDLLTLCPAGYAQWMIFHQ